MVQCYPDVSTPEYHWSAKHRSGTGDTLVVSIGVLREISDEVDLFMHEQEGQVLPAVHFAWGRAFPVITSC